MLINEFPYETINIFFEPFSMTKNSCMKKQYFCGLKIFHVLNIVEGLVG